jgi:general secretion pathway protein I
MKRRAGRQRGFTLLEVLIALAIVAMSAGALLGTITSSASNVSYLKDKTLAEWVALNRLTEIRIAQQIASPGKRTGSAEMGGMRWQWEEEVSELPIEGMFRVDVRARSTGEAVDDSRQSEKSTSQTEADTETSGAATEKLAWTTTVTGVLSGSTSLRREAIAAPFRGQSGNPQGGPNNPQNPSAPGAPGTPGAPGMPGTSPPPGNPGGGQIKPPANDR